MKQNLLCVMGIALLANACATDPNYSARYSPESRTARLEWIACTERYVDSQRNTPRKFELVDSVVTQAFEACKKQEDHYIKVAKLSDLDRELARNPVRTELQLRDTFNFRPFPG